MKRKIRIYQTYHNDSCKLTDHMNFIHFNTTEKIEEENINEYQIFFCEFVTLYYVYKNANKLQSDYVGFCHYGDKNFLNSDKILNYNNVIQYELNEHNNKLINDIINEKYELNNFEIFGLAPRYNLYQEKTLDFLSTMYDLDNNLYNNIFRFINENYPELIDRYKQLSGQYRYNINSLRYMSFICKWEDFEKFMQFQIKLLNYFGLYIENINSINDIALPYNNFIINAFFNHPWYHFPQNKYRWIAFFLEFSCSLYWYLSGYDIKYKYN